MKVVHQGHEVRSIRLYLCLQLIDVVWNVMKEVNAIYLFSGLIIFEWAILSCQSTNSSIWTSYFIDISSTEYRKIGALPSFSNWQCSEFFGIKAFFVSSENKVLGFLSDLLVDWVTSVTQADAKAV